MLKLIFVVFFLDNPLDPLPYSRRIFIDLKRLMEKNRRKLF
jgi:hypothetical protein